MMENAPKVPVPSSNKAVKMRDKTKRRIDLPSQPVDRH